MHMSRRGFWAAVLAGIAVPGLIPAGGLAAPAGPPALTTTYQVVAATDTALTMRFTARNNSSTPIDVRSLDLPRAHQIGEILSVTHDGTPVEYRGKRAKLAAPEETAYTRIPAGGAYTVDMRLADDYDLSRAGTYLVALTSTRIRGDDGPVRLTAGRGVVRTSAGVRGSAGSPRTTVGAPTISTQRVGVAAVTLRFANCSSSEQTQLRTAISNAYTYSTRAQSWLAGHTAGGGNYLTWFGAYSSARFNRATTTFAAITSQLTSKTVDLICDAASPYMAYVYQAEHYVIYLGRGYWPAAATGWDSKAGTLIHESSHFNVNGGADDHVYGLAEGQQLARTDPNRAVDNADNIEHFAESL
ncbi:M35 family metallo-endopeptidase [Actinoplanes sichuanensis]|uniref:M35 family metallo-endopeptidase n=1 Tax=Actinoplanes sichuanensis TaxID=512349 RepID=A0ABW4AIR5_9ACTN|nr:M35 family metallo-endopeptidase [Actinoplanes sichuanensis]BEL12088.1 M35 family metallo-endopeptidase [Actinoplanes sichuanensis]